MRPLIIFGPSGVGKGTIINSLIVKNPQLFKLTLSFTTRLPRPGQLHGQHYFFVSKQQFQQKIVKDQMLEHKIVFSNMYGTCKKNVEEIIQTQKIPILDVDVEGMLDIHKSLCDIVLEKQKSSEQSKICKPLCLCILPPSFKLLRERLSGRRTQSPQVVQKRMEQNLKQMQRIFSLQNLGIEGLFYSTNYQYQSTVYGIQSLLQKQHTQFAKYKNLSKLGHAKQFM